MQPNISKMIVLSNKINEVLLTKHFCPSDGWLYCVVKNDLYFVLRKLINFIQKFLYCEF